MTSKKAILSNQMFPSQDNIHNLIDLKFDERYSMYKFHHDSFDQFINEIAFKELEENPNLIYENVSKEYIYKYRLKYHNIQLKPPVDESSNEDEILFPEDARIKFLTYSSRLIADIKQIQEIINLETGDKTEKVIFEDKGVTVAKIPIMFRSNYCSTVLKKDRATTECVYDPGCYFIIKGAEKIIMSQERMIENKILVFSKKDSNFIDGITYSCQVYSKKLEDLTANLQIVSIKPRKDLSLLMTTSHNMQEIPIHIVFKALGIVSDKMINSYIVYNDNDTDMNNLLKYSLNHYKDEIWKDDNGNINYVRTQEDAINYLLTKIKIVGKRFSETNLEVRNMQKREYLMTILERDFLPHMGNVSLIKKAYFLGAMCHKLINCMLKRSEIDDRDSMVNKRIDTPGILLGQLFRQYYKKMLNDCTKYFRKKNISDDNPINIISQIKHSTIEQGINSALSTGTWGNTKKKGVAQMLQRLTYMQLISSLRRVITPQADTSSKIERMRFVHNTQYGFIDPVETPEHGHNVGTVKHLSNLATITINSSSQPEIIKSILDGKLIDLMDLPAIKLKIYTKVFLNGEWLGMTNKPVQLTSMLKDKRFLGEIERFVSIAHHYTNNEICINCDSGRLIRPILKVENNRILLTDDMINEINIKNKTNPKQIHTWNNFLMKYPNVIEYVDPEEQETLIISFWVKDVAAEYEKMMKPIENPNIFGDPINRYNDTVYKRYTHCEFHPSITFGNISCNVPFSEYNDSPRNYYNFSQARQALGIYTSNSRHRVDLAYNLFYPQIPLVYPRASRYTGLLDLPYGQNCVVAIAMYTGYNQEDSSVMNQSAIERGLFRAESYRKESDEITKNPATGQDEIFARPDRNKVAGMKDGNYDKLNDKGFIPEETPIKNNDVIIGKITPIQPGEASNKIFKDASLMYKGGVDGVIDRVYTGIKNADGYEMYNMRIRQERVPRGGDKFSSRMGQKATIGTTLRSEDMPFTAQGIRPDLIINPCCFTGDTLITMTNGLSKRISHFNTQGLEPVYTHDKQTGLVKSFSLGMESKGIKDIVKVILEDGRELKCTPDHKFLTIHNNNYEYKEIQYITSDDILVCGIQFTEDKEYFDEDKYENIDDREKTMIFARLSGYYYLQSSFEVHDTDIKADLKMIDMEIFDNKENLYEILEDCQRYLVREFLAGLFTYGGECGNNNVFIKLDNDIIDKLYKLLDKFSIKYQVEFFDTTQSIIKIEPIIFLENIGFRYNINKSYDLMNLVNGTNNNSITRISSIIPFGQEEVFDIGVAKHHNFVANGVVVSNCIPSRMTIGQLLESILSKASALEGHITETVPFDKVDANEIGKVLKSYGFDEHGLETLYCGFTGKKLDAQIFICPTHYLRLKHLVQDKIHCLDQYHDVLTLNGWKSIKDINMTDLIATLKDNRLVYENPIAVLSYPDYEGNMYYIKNELIDLATTGNHRMLVSKDDINYEFDLAENLVGQTVRYKKDSEWDIQDYVITDEIDIVNMESWLVLFGVWFESHDKIVNGQDDTFNSIKLSINNEYIINILTKALNELRYTHYVLNDKIVIYNKQLYSYFIQLESHKLPEWVFQLSRKQVQILINALLLDTTENKYYTRSLLLANQIQQLAVHAGWDCIYGINECLIELTIIKENINPLVNVSIKQDYIIKEKCPVYCLQVPSEIFYVRRNGKAVWTGNSRARGPVTLLTHQPPEGRSRDGGLRFGNHFAKKQTQNVLLVCVWQATQSNCGEVLITRGIVCTIQY